MAALSRRLRQFAYPILYPGSGRKRVCFIGDSHVSYINSLSGSSEDRYIYGALRKWQMQCDGLYSPGGSPLWITTFNAGFASLSVGALQHSVQGYIAPHDVAQITPGAPIADGTLLIRSDCDATALGNIYRGNPFTSQALTAKIIWWGRADSLQTVRMRSGYTNDTYTEDTSNIDTRGADAYSSRSMSIASSASLIPRWDSFTGSENETGREWTYIGMRLERATSTGGVSFACLGNGGMSATDYTDGTICNDARLQDWLAAVGPFDRFIQVTGTNMEVAESADIRGVWAAKSLAMSQKFLTLNAAAGGPSDAMVLQITGHDANITGRYAAMADAVASCSAADPRIAHLDTWGVLQSRGINYAAMAATYLAPDGVHFNSAGADLLGGLLWEMFVTPPNAESSDRSARTSRIIRAVRC